MQSEEGQRITSDNLEVPLAGLPDTGLAVPEPTGVSLLAIAALALLRRRLRRYH